MILVDSTVWIDYFNGRITTETDYLHQILGDDEIVVGDIILGEVLQGFRSDQDFEAAYQALSTFDQVNIVDASLAVQSAHNYRFLRKRGVTVRKMIDCFIATCAIVRDLRLLHCDKDFDPFEQYLGLQVIHPEATR
jgi:predicted nucleic acid-binding protein